MTKLGRRQAMGRIGKAALVAAGAAGLGAALWDRGGFGPHRARAKPQVRDYRVRGADADGPKLAIAEHALAPAELTRRAVEALGGMARFIEHGDVVAIKPNIGWDRTPIHAANTNPQVVAELVRLVFAAGAARVVVTDASCNEPSRCFQRSGIWKAAYDAGADVILPSAHRFRALRLGGEVLDEWPIYRPIIDADKVINAPVAKHHNLAKYTGAMKNWYGVLGGRRNRLHQSIDLSIADLATFLRPTLTVIDATRVLMRNGPQGGNVADARDAHTVIASTDQVAADAYACRLVEVRPEDVAYLSMGEARGLGTTRWESLDPVRG